MSDAKWAAVDAYLGERLVGEDEVLRQAAASSVDAGLPDIRVSATQGKLIAMLAGIQGARRVLEVGTLGGYSTIWLARALPDDGRVVTLEIDPHHADVAQANFQAAGLADRIELRVGMAADSLQAMIDAGEEPFDFVFVDADKPSNPVYLDFAVRLSRPGALIFVDNVVRNGGVADPDSTDRNVIGVRAMMDAIAANPRLEATAVQTVGEKGYDGFCLIRVIS
jgi:predicted O-methyltransferase YrrM